MPWKVKRVTVQTTVPLPPVHPQGYLPCDHEVTYFSTTDWLEYCAICGEFLGEWKKRPR